MNQTKTTSTACSLCTHGCGLEVEVDTHTNRITKVSADPKNPYSQGYVCNKGFSIGHYVQHAQRVKTPLRRRPDGTHEAISWETAIREIAERLGSIRRDHSPDAIALFGIGGQGNHMDSLYAMAFLVGLGSRWWFNSFAQEKTQHAMVDRWLFNATPCNWLSPDEHRTSYLLVLGSNPMLSNRGVRPTDMIKDIQRDPERTLVVVDPRGTETSRLADEHLAIQPSSDVYLLLGMVAHIVQAGLGDPSLHPRVAGLRATESFFAAIDVAGMAARCGIEPASLRSVAEGFARAPSATVLVDLGLEQGRHNTLTAYLLRVLVILTGNLGTPGGMLFAAPFIPDLGRFDAQPKRAPESGIAGVPALGPFQMFSPNLLPEEVLNARPDRIRALIVEGSNPMLQAANSARVREALEALELSVVIDPAYTETAAVADYVLPTMVGYEKWEYSVYPKGYPETWAQLRPPVVRHELEGLAEPEIYWRLAKAMGLTRKASPALKLLSRSATNPLTAPAFFAQLGLESAALSKDAAFARSIFLAYDSVGERLPHKALASFWLYLHAFVVSRRPAVRRAMGTAERAHNPLVLAQRLFDDLLEHPEGRCVAVQSDATNLDENLKTRSRKIELFQPLMLAEARRALAEGLRRQSDYPFILNGGLRTRWNANVIHRDPAWRKGKGPHFFVLIHPDDAARLDIAQHDEVELATRVGSIRAPARLDSKTMPGTLSVPAGFGMRYPNAETGALETQGASINLLTDARDRDPFTGCPHHKYLACSVTKVNAEVVAAE